MTQRTIFGNHYDVVVVGAGPAGLAAATECSTHGLKTVLFDEQASPGGQIYRSVDSSPIADRRIFDADYWHGKELTKAFVASGATYVPSALVWSISHSREIGVSVSGSSHLITTESVILATGAQERPFPILGWTLPGVMTAGAAQILLKSSGLHPQGPTVLAGCGPLLWLLAAQYLRAGFQIEVILDTASRENRRRAAAKLLGFLFSSYALKGLGLLAEVRRKVRIVKNVVRIDAIGEECLREVQYCCDDGQQHPISASTLLLHHGVVPNINLSSAVGCEHTWDSDQICFRPKIDQWGESTVSGVFIPGDGGGIAGARSAEHAGRLAALQVACVQGRIDLTTRDSRARAHLKAVKKLARGRAFLDSLYAPAMHFRAPEGEIIVCRCEGVTAKQIRDVVARGCTDPNQVKAFLRCGMGPCQGRLCGLTVVETIAAVRTIPTGQAGYFRLRFPIKPITLGELAATPLGPDTVDGVVRDLPPCGTA